MNCLRLRNAIELPLVKARRVHLFWTRTRLIKIFGPGPDKSKILDSDPIGSGSGSRSTRRALPLVDFIESAMGLASAKFEIYHSKEL